MKLFDENLSPLLVLLVWLRTGNCTTEFVRDLLCRHPMEVDALQADPVARYCVIE